MVWSPLPYCPHSSLPPRCWPGRPPGPPAPPARHRRHPAVVAGGPPGRRRRGPAGRAVLSARRPHDRHLQDRGRRQPRHGARPTRRLGFCQPDGSFITTLDDLRELLAEMAASGEAMVVDRLATRVQRPCGWTTRRCPRDAERHSHTARGLAVATVWGDLLWLDGGRPGSCHEHERLALAGLGGCWTPSRSSACWTGGSGAWPSNASIGMPGRGPAQHRPAHRRPAGLQPPAGGAAGAGGASIPTWQAPGRWPRRLYRVRDVFRPAGALICLSRRLHRVPT
jgi:hypothetical protein